MLKRHLCVIDLKSSMLGLGSAGASVPFLSEKDLPSSARETQAEDLENKKPAAAEGSGSPASAETAPTGAGAGSAAPASSAMDTETPSTASAASASATPATAAAAGAGGAEEAKVTQLTAMGFSREQAEGALSSTGGDAEQAAGLLLAQMDL
ncbi:unnamed protein product [Ectocarpus sp. 13 AM-2016]